MSGLCTRCVDGCKGNCEIFKATFRSREVIYPGPFGDVTAGGDKNYPVDYLDLLRTRKSRPRCLRIAYVMLSAERRTFLEVRRALNAPRRLLPRLELALTGKRSYSPV